MGGVATAIMTRDQTLKLFTIMAQKVNWCSSNCEGRFFMTMPTKETASSFNFDHDTDAVLYKMKWEGVK